MIQLGNLNATIQEKAVYIILTRLISQLYARYCVAFCGNGRYQVQVAVVDMINKRHNMRTQKRLFQYNALW